ncbi:MAG: hypothetical protein ACK5JS_07225 [Mangrovibacterium sp.]
MKVRNYIKIILVIAVIFISCKKKPEKYEYCKAYVYNSTRIHWGFGYYHLMVDYRFDYEGEKYEGKYKYKKLSTVTSKAFEKGDSVLIKFPENDVSESIIIKRTYKKRKATDLDMWK